MINSVFRYKKSWVIANRFVVLLGLLPGFARLPAQSSSSATEPPLFTQFTYKGNDTIYKANPLQPGEFYSPILQGCYPDPSITRKGSDYYLVNSSFAMVPGVPIFHSTNLVNWKPLGYVLDRPSQLKVERAGISAGIYAPQISYNKNNNTFYLITTHIAAGLGNMVVKTKDPAQGWSDPIKLDFDGIDPSLFFDDNGKAYVVHNDAPPKGTEQYNGHRVIKLWEYDVQSDKIIPGTDKILVNGGTDITQKPIWIEGPHLYKKGGKYYLMCAEGGTGNWHSEVIFKSDSPTGPFVPAGSNPILSQRHLAKDRTNKIDWAGHADLVEGPNGKYYAVFLAVRPNEKGRVNTGRETFMLPVDWSGEFPVVENGLVPMQPKLKTPPGVTNQTGQDGFFANGNFTFRDDFTNKKLDLRWISIRGWRDSFAVATKDGLRLTPSQRTIQEPLPVSALFHRQQHRSFEATTTLRFRPQTGKDLAGIVCYQNERFHYVFGLTRKGPDTYLVLQRMEKGSPTLIASEKVALGTTIQLQVVAKGDDYTFNYSTGGQVFKNVGGTVSGDILSTDVAGGFTGALVGLYATSGNGIVP